MSECTGPDCTNKAHNLDTVQAGEAEVHDLAPEPFGPPIRRGKPPLPRNTIIKRVWSREGYFYFRMGDGSLIKPETALKRGLIDAEAYKQALQEEMPFQLS